MSPRCTPPDDGRTRFGRNVAFAWGGYMFNVVSGFIVPRLISDHLGQPILGIWDFTWSLVAYFGLVQLGLSGSVSRYVAAYRAKNDVKGLNRSVSTIAIFQRSVGWIAFVLALLTAWWLPQLFASKLGNGLETARLLILIQGTEIAVVISLSISGSVIAGCHRWDLQHSVNAIAEGLVALTMVAALLLGGGLPTLALAHLAIMTAAELVRWRLLKHVCPELEIGYKLARWRTFLEQARYSFKTLVPSVSNLVSNQAVSLLIVAFLGPASLAIFSRSRSLMAACRTFAAKFGLIIVPTASALEAMDDQTALRATFLNTSALISSLALPVMLILGLFGDHLMRIWMGPAYVTPWLIGILTVGTYATVTQEPVWSVLSGMNRHGWIATIKLLAAFLSVGILALGLREFHWGLCGAAVCFALPQLLIDGVITPCYSCRLLKVTKCTYFWQVYARPMLCNAPFAITLAIGLASMGEHPNWATAAIACGFLASSLLYLRCLAPAPLRQRITSLLLKLTPRHFVRTYP